MTDASTTPFPLRAFELMDAALRLLEERLDIRPALTALDSLKSEMKAAGPSAFPAGSLERVAAARAIVDDDPDQAYQELYAIADSWSEQWGYWAGGE